MDSNPRYALPYWLEPVAVKWLERYHRGSGNTGIAAGGAAVSNAGKITTLTNSGAISGGGGQRLLFGTAVGGAGVSNSGSITTLTNRGMISGGSASGAHPTGGAGVFNATGATIRSLSNAIGVMIFGGAGGAGISNAGTIATLTNGGKISGGGGTLGGAKLANSGSVTTLINSGTIGGSAGGAGRVEFRHDRDADQHSGAISGGERAGVSNSGAIKMLVNTNGGAINGLAPRAGSNAALGAGVSNLKTGEITTLSNSGAINGGGTNPSADNAAGGAAVSNFGTIEMLANNVGGVVSGGEITSPSAFPPPKRHRDSQLRHNHDTQQQRRDQRRGRKRCRARQRGRRRRGVQRGRGDNRQSEE